jgi:ATP-binding cassette subfamily B protein
MILILSGGALIISGKLTIGQLVTFNGLLWALAGPLGNSGNLINDFMRFRASLERIHQLASRESSIKNPEGAHAPERAEGRIEFRGVDFSYGDAPVLRGIDLTIEPGTTLGVLGPTGSGKSTLAKLICRYYDAKSGEVLLDGTDVRRYGLRSLRSNVGIAMQDVFLFSDTIEGNIAFGRPESSEAEVRRCAELADADSFIREMPEGYDTIVGERGVGLSGGQRQRIALARLFLKDTPVMVLDDTTSSVDVETEERIRAAVSALPGERTKIVIAHRISSIQDADRIIVLQDGRITQSGTHGELILEEGYYREVWLHQTGRIA